MTKLVYWLVAVAMFAGAVAGTTKAGGNKYYIEKPVVVHFASSK